MNFIHWCDVVLKAIVEVDISIGWNRELYFMYDVQSKELMQFLLNDIDDKNLSEQYIDLLYRSIYWAVAGLSRIGLVEMDVIQRSDEPQKIYVEDSIAKSERQACIASYNELKGENDPPMIDFTGLPLINDDLELMDRNEFSCEITIKGREFLANNASLWLSICSFDLTESQIGILEYVNRTSLEEYPHFCFLAESFYRDLHDNTDDPEYRDVRILDQLGFITLSTNDKASISDYDFYVLRSTYKGLVWEQMRETLFESLHIDKLISEGETTSVEFKRELQLDKADKKAEFVKDVLSLVNTRASGKHLLIIGFEDKTYTYFGPPDPGITLDRIENVLSTYTEPFVDVKYRVINYKGKSIGKLEVIRDPQKLPYRVKKALGDKKRIEIGKIFVRHGSHVEPPTLIEQDALIEEGNMARGNARVIPELHTSIDA